MFADPGPGELSSPYRVDGEARVTDRRLGSLGLILLLGSPMGVAGPSIGCSLISSFAYPKPLSCDSVLVSLRMW